MNEEYKSFEVGRNAYRGMVATIEHDEDLTSPREDMDNLGTMVCFHRHYSLGDKDGLEKVKTAIGCHPDFKSEWGDTYSEHYKDLSDPTVLIELLERLDFIFLPLYLYDHSGITMNTTGFSCPWDSGQVGFIFVTREDAAKEFKVNEEFVLRVENCLRSEVGTYDTYLTGDVWCWTVGDLVDGMEDSCCGCYGFEYACKEAAEAIDRRLERKHG